MGYGLPVGRRFVGTPRVGVSTSAYGRDVRLGYSLGMLDRETLHVKLGVDAQRRERPRGKAAPAPAPSGGPRCAGEMSGER